MEILRKVMAHPWWSKNSKNPKTKIRSGFVPVKVGEEGENLRRFVVPIRCFSSKTFQALLEEHEDHIHSTMQRRGGPIHLPCSVQLFQAVLDSAMDDNVHDDDDDDVALHGHGHPRSYHACFKIGH